MKRLLIVNQHQFGYLTDSYAWCKYLRNDWAITYLGWDHGGKRVEVEGVQVEYVSRRGSKPLRLFRYIRAAIARLRREHFDAVIVVYFRGASLLLPWVNRSTTIVDIRTGSDQPGTLQRTFENLLLRVECLLYKERTIVSESLQKTLSLGRAEFTVLPLGGEKMMLPPKKFESIRLFYVGTLEYRSIHETVLGLDQWWTTRKPSVTVSYDIVGSGREEEEAALTKAIQESPLRSSIRFHGRKPNPEIIPFLERCNVGVAYVPKTWYYDCQPSTKVFEYLLAGMPVIATSTSENALVITRANGVLTEDTIDGFAHGVDEISRRLQEYDSRQIAASSQQYAWQEIVTNILAPRLDELKPNGSAGTAGVGGPHTTNEEIRHLSNP
ncbi:MAG: glycosyltransferase [Bacteroidota bacterium]